MSLASPLTQVPAIVSCVGALFVVASWALCRRWRAKVESGKRILLIIGCMDAIAAANYFNAAAKDTHASCLTQALIMQTFEISSWNYNAVLAYEVYFLVTSSISVLLRDKDRFYRHLLYHVIVIGFAVASVATSLANGVMGAAGNWCWLNDATYRIGFGYVPLWIGFAIIIGCNAMVLRMVVASEKNHQQRTNSSDKRSRLLFRAGVMRLLIVPLAFILLHIPGTLRRIMEAATYDGSWYVWIGSLQEVCDPSQGTLTALLYLGLDTDLRREWWFVLQGRGRDYQGESSTFSNSRAYSNNTSTSCPPPSDLTASRNNSAKTDGSDRPKPNSLEGRFSSAMGALFRNSRFSVDQRADSSTTPTGERFTRDEYVDVDFVDDDPMMYSMERNSSFGLLFPLLRYPVFQHTKAMQNQDPR